MVDFARCWSCWLSAEKLLPCPGSSTSRADIFRVVHENVGTFDVSNAHLAERKAGARREPFHDFLEGADGVRDRVNRENKQVPGLAFLDSNYKKLGDGRGITFSYRTTMLRHQLYE